MSQQKIFIVPLDLGEFEGAEIASDFIRVQIKDKTFDIAISEDGEGLEIVNKSDNHQISVLPKQTNQIIIK